MLLSLCNSFEDSAPRAEIYGCQMFKCIVTYLNIEKQDSSPNNGRQGDIPYYTENLYPAGG